MTFETNGPKKFKEEYLSCRQCKYFYQKMLISGREPIYDGYCKHPKILENKGIDVWISRNRQKTTPPWCPCLNITAKEHFNHE